MPHRKLINFVCLDCGVTFQDNPSQKRKYCSKVCADKSKPTKPKTMLICQRCDKSFGSISGSLKQKYCSRHCAAIRGRSKKTVTKPIAKNAQRLLKYYIDKGRIIRPNKCEECKQEKKIEGAHYNYNQPLKVRWLCTSCHRLWDRKEPKGGTYAVSI